MITQLLRLHGLTANRHNDWIYSGEPFPLITANFFKHNADEKQWVLAFEVSVMPDKETTIELCFAGIAKTQEDAFTDALDNFCQSAVHVLLEAFWNHCEPDQTEAQQWKVDNRYWYAIIGNSVVRTFGGELPKIPEGFLSAIQGTAEELHPAGGLLWISTYYANNADGSRTIETKINNEDNSDLEKAIASLPWPERSDFYGVRNFIVLKDEGS